MIFIHSKKSKQKPKYELLFDEIITHDFSKDISELVKVLKKIVTDPKKTRLVTVSDST